MLVWQIQDVLNFNYSVRDYFPQKTPLFPAIVPVDKIKEQFALELMFCTAVIPAETNSALLNKDIEPARLLTSAENFISE